MVERNSGGTFVAVVGPSGAGKDTLIAAARAAFAGNPKFCFPRRVVTRTATQHEDHDTIELTGFRQTVADGGYALHWEAHGLGYGLPVAIDAEIAASRIVIANVSRGIIGAARERYAKVQVIFVDAAPEVLAARIAARGRETASGSRLDASRGRAEPARGDLTIDNSGDVAIAAAAFIRSLEGL